MTGWNPKQYELLVKRLLFSKLRADFAKSPVIKHRQRFLGASGQAHEIDLAFETNAGGPHLQARVQWLREGPTEPPRPDRRE
jgi:hypothetical protein